MWTIPGASLFKGRTVAHYQYRKFCLVIKGDFPPWVLNPKGEAQPRLHGGLAHLCDDALDLALLLTTYCPGALQDRKSTRLNSSHLVISYAVFCLKKKT